ncbi:MAG: phytase [Bacteroidales bacterium]|nr:phytase [Bacteroidales bacterium]MDD3664031.1 phytase [Bacteroidales bacterium]
MNSKQLYVLLAVVLSACSGTQQPQLNPAAVQAIAETTPMPVAGDAADDPAIWINYANPGGSLLVGTNKKAGLSVFSLDGRLLNHFDVGRINNVDIRQGFPLGADTVDLVAGSNRTDNTVLVMTIDSAGMLRPVLKTPIQSALEEVYGFCLYHELKSNRFFAIVNGKSGEVEQWELLDAGNGQIEGRLARAFAVNGQPEGCVADDELGFLYLGEEDRGLWKFDASPEGSKEGILVDTVGKGRLVADVEGVALWYGLNGQGYLVVSSQGNNTYAVYERQGNNRYLGSFQITDGDLVDGVAETDGIEATSVPLGTAFPLGIFVAQDGFNTDRGTDANQNFKIVDWQKIALALQLPE